MFRQIIIFFLFASLTCCQKKATGAGMIDQSFDIRKANEVGLDSIRSLAFESKAWEAAQESSKEQGWKAARARGEPIPAATSFKNRDEELGYYGGVIFRSLGYPLQENSQFSISTKTDHEVCIRHSKEALTQFELLLERWKRSRDEKFNDLLNGKP